MIGKDRTADKVRIRKKFGLSFIGAVVNFSSKFVGGIKKRFSGRTNFLKIFLLGGGDRCGEKLRGQINNGADTGFKFEIKPEEKIGFFHGNSGGTLSEGAGLAANKPHQRGDKNY